MCFVNDLAPLIIQAPNTDRNTLKNLNFQNIVKLPTKYPNAALCRLWGGTAEPYLVAWWEPRNMPGVR